MISVLFIVVVMSFLVLAIAQTASRAAERQFATRARAELYWYAVGLESLATVALGEAISAQGAALTAENPVFGRVYELPLETGEAELAFNDATRCLDVNSFSRRSDSGRFEINPRARAAMISLGATLGLGNAEAEGVVSAVADWIDADAFQEPRGAEDAYYTALPAPYRTGAAPLADVSEIRAIAGVNEDIYKLLRPALCARNGERLTSINVNMLTPADAPLLSAVLGEAVDVGRAQEIIASLPPGGYSTMEEFWQAPAVAPINQASDGQQGLSAAIGDNLSVASRYIAARGVVRQEKTSLELNLLLEIQGNNVTVISRRIGRRS